MRILWYSNAPWCSTGYGGQTALICKYLPRLGHDIAVVANFGLRGKTLSVEGIPVYPAGTERYSNDVVKAYADEWKADVVVSLYDVWPLSFARAENWDKPWVAWTPVDHETPPLDVFDSLQYAKYTISISEHGQRVLSDVGIKASFIPHGIETDHFAPGDQMEARRAAGLDIGSAFLVGMVAANKHYPSRKCIPQALAAFRGLKDVTTNAVLYLHMIDDERQEGVNVRHICKSLGLDIGTDVLFANPYRLHMGFDSDAMVNLFRSFDVLLNPSIGEGFGIPIIEAMACGTPVIGTNGTSMRELISGAGWVVSGEPWWSPQGAWQTLPRVQEIEHALEAAYLLKNCDTKSWGTKREISRQRAEAFDFERRVAQEWNNFLSGMAAQ